jgi:hypothetical protein
MNYKTYPSGHVESITENLNDLTSGKNFLDTALKTRFIKEKIDKMYFIKILKF